MTSRPLPGLVGTAEVGRFLGASRQRAPQVAEDLFPDSAGASFPDPATPLDTSEVRLGEAVSGWAHDDEPRTRRGRPRRRGRRLRPGALRVPRDRSWEPEPAGPRPSCVRTALVLSALLLTAACGQGGTAAPAAAPASPGSTTPDAAAASVPAAEAAPGRAGAWPDLRPPTAASCVSRYPDGLRANTTAVDATVTAVTVGEFDDDAGMRPATVDLAVHEAFAGPARDTLTLRTWDGSLPGEPQAAVGLRVLASAGDTLDLQGCGYTRPYDPDEAQRWRTVFAGPAPSPTPAAPTRAALSVTGDMNKGDDGLRADFRVTVRRPDGGRVLACSVSWGDSQSSSTSLPGTCPAAPGPLEDDVVIRHTYPGHGLYDVVVTVITGGCGAPEDAARATAEAVVGPAPGSH